MTAWRPCAQLIISQGILRFRLKTDVATLYLRRAIALREAILTCHRLLTYVNRIVDFIQ
jgi:hypothetical protein